MHLDLLAMATSSLAHNQFLSGGLVLGGIGMVRSKLMALPSKVLAYIKSKFIKSHLSVDIVETDTSIIYSWVRTWASLNIKEVNTFSLTNKDIRTVDEKTGKVKFSPWFEKVPDAGTYTVKWKDCKLVIDIKKAGGEGEKATPNSFTLRFYSKDVSTIDNFLRECKDLCTIKDSNSVTVFSSVLTGWKTVDSIPVRDKDSVITCDQDTNEIIDDVIKFVKAKDDYAYLGIPYHRGYLFYGPPGNGKTSLIKVIASEIERDIRMLNLSSIKSNDDLMDKCASAPSSSIIVIEDIDCVLNGRDSIGDLTFSGLLNCLDGVCTKQGQIIILTTNHVEKLDPALIRPGRIDKKVYFPNASHDQIHKMAVRFGCDEQEAKTFVAAQREGQNMASIQEKLITLKGINIKKSGKKEKVFAIK